MPKTKVTSYRLSDKAHAILGRLSEKLGTTRAGVIEQALRWYESWVDAGWRPPVDDTDTPDHN